MAQLGCPNRRLKCQEINLLTKKEKKEILESFLDQKNRYISYEELCRSNLYWKDILDYLDIKDKYNFTFTNSFRELNLDYDVELLNKAVTLYNKLS